MAERGPEPGSARSPETGPDPGSRPETGSRLREAGKAIGCLILAVIVLAIAVVMGVFDIFF